MLRVLEPPGSCHEILCKRLFDGTYDKPFIVDNGRRRFLHFDFDAVQSAMETQDPHKLTLAYTRKMMAFLLFKRDPGRILLLGLGGGSLAKFCYKHLGSVALTAIEVNPDVIALREEFCIPADDERFRVIQADGATYVSRLAPCKDVILADGCDREGIAPELSSVEFYQNIRRSLAPGGVFVTNVCGDEASRAAHLLKLRNAFDDEFLTLPVRPKGSVVAFGFRERCPPGPSEGLEPFAAALGRQYGLDFPKFARRIALDSKLRGWQRAFA